MIVSVLSIGFSGSKKTRLLKHGLAGKTVDIVDVSWIAKPCGMSSHHMMLSDPDLDVDSVNGPLPAG